jgi:hypothetical protein
MKVQYLSLLLLMPSMQAMNQVTPTTPALTDAQIIAQALPEIVNLSEELIPHLAATLKANPEAANATQAVVTAASNALQEKNATTVSKSNSAYIAAGASVITAIVTALASTYGKKNC